MAEVPLVSSTGLSVLSRKPVCAQGLRSSLDSWVTLTSHIFIRNHFAAPSLDISGWSLAVEGEVEGPVFLRYDDLEGRPSKEVVCVLECAGNSRTPVQPPVDGVLWEHGGVGINSIHAVPVEVRPSRAR